MYIDISFLILLSITLLLVLAGLVATIIRQRKTIDDYTEIIIISGKQPSRPKDRTQR